MTTITAELIEFIAPVIENEPDAINYITEIIDHFKEPYTIEDLQVFADEIHDTYLEMKKENKEDIFYNKKIEIELKFKSIIGLDSEQQTLLKLLPSNNQELLQEKMILDMVNSLIKKKGDYHYFMSIFFILIWIEILRKNRDFNFDRQMVFGEYNINKKYFGDSEINNNEHYEKVIKMLQNKNQQ